MSCFFLFFPAGPKKGKKSEHHVLKTSDAEDHNLLSLGLKRLTVLSNCSKADS